MASFLSLYSRRPLLILSYMCNGIEFCRFEGIFLDLKTQSAVEDGAVPKWQLSGTMNFEFCRLMLFGKLSIF